MQRRAEISDLTLFSFRKPQGKICCILFIHAENSLLSNFFVDNSPFLSFYYFPHPVK